MSAPDIFLSYNREDAEVARCYADAFAAAGLEVWWDQTLKSGEDYDEVTEAALRGARAVVVLWSPRSVASRWVRAEATIADRNKTLMPVTIEPCNRPVMFELKQTAELSHWRGEAVDPAWLAFLGDVRRMAGIGGLVAIESPVAIAPASDESGSPSIVAVLPITCRASGEEMQFLTEDLTEDITRELARHHFFKVIAAQTMANVRGKELDFRSLGRDLKARYLIESKLQRAGEDIRLTVQLIDTASASMVWSPRFVRKSDDIDGSPEEFSGAVASALGEHIFQLEMTRVLTNRGLLSGWELVLRALSPTMRIGSYSMRNALEDARKAVVLAPNLGLAHALLAALLAAAATTLGFHELNDARREEIQEHIIRAMILDGDNPAVLTTLVNAYAVLADWESGLKVARRAVELEPRYAQAIFALARAQFMMGRTTDAIATFREHLRIGPEDFARTISLHLLGICLCLEGKIAEAEVAIEHALALHPNFDGALRWKALIATLQKQEPVAQAAIMRLRTIEPGMSFDQHMNSLAIYPLIHERVVEVFAILRPLWEATEPDA